MPEIKNNFTSGKMNKDLDERLIPKNEYRDALNIDITTTEGSDVGSAQNSYGNVKVSSLGITGAKCIGSALNPENQKVIWFVSGDSVDAIAEYDQTTQQVEPILVDNHSGNVSFLNFRVQNGIRTIENNLITGINVIDGMLFFTDGENEPKKINIDRFKKGVADSNEWSTTFKFVDANNVVTTNNVLEDDITVVKQYPLNAPTLELYRDIAGTGDPSSCTVFTPTNTTRTSWGAVFGAGSTDSVEYYNSIYLRTLDGDVASATLQFNNTDDGGNVSASPYWNNVVVGMTLTDETGRAIPNPVDDKPIGVSSKDDSNHTITLSANPAFTVAPCSVTNGSPNVTHNADSKIKVGQYVVGNNIPTGTKVLSITNSTQLVLSANATGTASLQTLTFTSLINNEKVGFRWSLSPHRNESFWKYVDINGALQLKPEGTTSNSNLKNELGATVFDENGNTIKTQKIVFNPRPNFIENDVVVLSAPNTIATSSSNAEVKIRIRLLSEDIWNDPVHSNQYRKVFDFKILSIDEDILAMSNTDLRNWNATRETSTSIFEDKFPRFAYRWKYIDGEYSCISAFSEVAFLPTEEGYNFDSALGANTNIQNTVSKIVLKEFDTMPQDVVSLDVLIKFSDSQSIYKYKTIDSTDLASLTTFEVTSDQIHAMLPSNQILRPYDNVPKAAKAQEITANRLLYANYTNQYNVDEEPRFELSVQSSKLEANQALKSVKSLRTYQLGASLLDKFGRQTPVYSQADTCTINLSQEESYTANNFFVTNDFVYPDWATHIKHYIKEPQGEFYNITMDRIYEAETEEFVWISFPSSDVNKVSEGDHIVLKKAHDTSTPILPIPKTIKYKVIAKESSAPDVIKVRRNLVGRLENQQFATNGDTSTGYPVEGGIVVRLRGTDGIATSSRLSSIADATSADRYIRIGSYVKNTVSNFYEVESIQKVDDNDDGDFTDNQDYYEILLKRPFGSDINFVGGAPGSTDRTEYFELYEQELKEFDEEFQGRFFIKVLKDDYLKENITEVLGSDGTNYGIVSTQPTYWIQNVYTDEGANQETGFGDNAAKTNVHGNMNASFLKTYSWPSIGPTITAANANTSDTQLFNSITGVPVGSKIQHQITYLGQQVWQDMLDYSISDNPPITVTDIDPNDDGTNTLKFSAQFEQNSGEQFRIKLSERISDDLNVWAEDGDDPSVWVPGTLKNYWGYKGAPDTRVYLQGKLVGKQRWAIDQAWSWFQGETPDNSSISLDDTSKPTGFRSMGHGFVVGQTTCDFRIFNLGPRDGGYTFHSQTGPSRQHITENFTLFQRLQKPGTQFRWTNDPTGTVYTVEEALFVDINNHTNVSTDDNYGHRHNQGVRFHLKLDQPIKWSPCQRYYDDATESNTGSVVNPGKIKPYWGVTASAAETNSSELQILEPVTIGQTFNSDSPAVFEVLPKESSDLNLYYETPKTSLILRDDMFVERDVIKPNGAIDTNVFVADAQIVIVDSALMEPAFYIKGDAPHSEQVKRVEAGSYVTVYTKDANGNAKFKQKLLIKNGVEAPGVANDSADDGGSHTGAARNNFYYKVPLHWYNCYAYGNGVESNRIQDAFNEPIIDNGPRVSTTFMGQYEEETKPNGIIFSGIYNGASSINNLNQFIMAEGITKDLNPSYGSIQKLFTRNTNVITFCEHKTLKVLANKDALFNADGKTNVTATNKVLGQTIPFAGEFGISKNPESFASYGYRAYYTDKNRNAVLRLSMDGITNISEKGMSTFFKENLSNSDSIVGSYDEDKDTYNVTLNGKTVSFSEKVNGWTSLKSFLPEAGFSVSGDYYTVKDGELYQHNQNLLRNYFYGVQYESSIKFIFNDEPSLIKNFNTLGYEGTTSRVYSNDDDNVALVTNGWYASAIETDQQSGQVVEFKEKEGKWFNNIIGVATTDENIDTSEFTMQGLGTIPASGVSVGDGTHLTRYTHTVFAYAPESPDPTVTLVGGIFGYSGGNSYPTSESGNPAAIGETHANSGFTVNSAVKTTGTAVGGLRYLRNICNDLILGETYTITADITISANPSNKTVGFIGGGLPASARIDSTGVISHTWTVTKNTNISLFKGKNVACVIDNISVMVTPQDQPRSPKFRINTSPNDATVTTFKTSVTNAADTTIDNDAYNGGNDQAAFYVHPLMANGAKWAVQASGITVTTPSDPLNLLRAVTKEDGYINSGVWTASSAHQGLHTNVVRVKIGIVGTMPSWNIDSICKFVVTPTLTQS